MMLTHGKWAKPTRVFLLRQHSQDGQTRVACPPGAGFVFLTDVP